MDNVNKSQLTDTMQVVSPPIEIPESNSNLLPKQQRFVNAYIQCGDATKACIIAGYAPKSANVEANRMLKRANVINALKDWKKSKRELLTKDSFIDKAMNSFEELGITEPNKPRFLDIAGKALGYTSPSSVQSNNTTNIQVNIDTNGKNQAELWDIARKLLGS